MTIYQDYLQESLVVDENGKLTMLIYPVYEQADKKKLTDDDLKAIYEKHRKLLNVSVPSYMNVAAIRVLPKNLKKHPKKASKGICMTRPECR